MKMKNFLTPKFYLTDQEKARFEEKISTQMLSYLWVPLCLLLLFQLYNIGYVLFYTDFSLRSDASKVYFALYLSLLVVLVFSGSLFYLLPRKFSGRTVLRSIWSFSMFLQLWSLCITVYDQRVSDNTSVFMLTTLSIAVLIYIPPRIFVPMLLTNQVLFLCFLPLFQDGQFGDNYGVYVNSIWGMLTALFLCYYHYLTAQQNFQNELIIEKKTALLLETNKKLDDLAKKDQLTGACNRHYLYEYLNRLCTRDKPFLCLYMIDIDNFKQYNDHFGHISGDDCLKKVASNLQKLFADKKGCLFRFGGEEFLGILLNDHAAFLVAQSLCQSIEKLQIPSAVPGIPVTVSVGVSWGVLEGETSWKNYLQEADEALYLAKKNGKNQLCISKKAWARLTPDTKKKTKKERE